MINKQILEFALKKLEINIKQYYAWLYRDEKQRDYLILCRKHMKLKRITSSTN